MSGYFNLKLSVKLLIGFIFTGVLAGIIGMAGLSFVSANERPLAAESIPSLLLILAIALIVSVLLGMFFSKGIGISLKRVKEAADKLSSGDTDVQFHSSPRNEMGELMSSILKISDYIRSQVEAAKKIESGEIDFKLKEFSDRDILSRTLNDISKNIESFHSELETMSKQHFIGEIDTFLKEDQAHGIFKSISHCMNEMIKEHIQVKKNVMACIAQFAQGDFDAELEKLPGKKAFINENVEDLRNNIKLFINEMNNMSALHDAGDIDVFVPEEKFHGAYKVMAQGVNQMVKGHIDVKKKAMACVAEFARGNFNAELERFPGKKAFINENIEELRKNLQEVNAEIRLLITASEEGKLLQRADAQKFEGDWAVLIKGLNGLLDAIIEPIKEAKEVLEEIAKGNFQGMVKGNYKGDHAKIKDALNEGIDTINEIMNEISNAAQQVASGSKQMSDSSLALSQGATEQASSIEELTASLEEISSQTKENADNAENASKLAMEAKEYAKQGNIQMSEMLNAMEEINHAAGNISKIIKVIDEIAFQTNILALNAAVEAARAGQHGKGFAVVAEEVRNLAARSANAAKETTDLIEGSIHKVEGGTNIANETAVALNKIVEGVTSVADLVGNIAIASNEQASAIEQINQGVMQISKVVQTNSATSEEGAAASEELATQAEMLKMQVAKFKLRKMNTNVVSYKGLEELHPDVMKKLEQMRETEQEGYQDHSFAEVAAAKQIVLSDQEFGKY